jgi:hypothetical protein
VAVARHAGGSGKLIALERARRRTSSDQPARFFAAIAAAFAIVATRHGLRWSYEGTMTLSFASSAL